MYETREAMHLWSHKTKGRLRKLLSAMENVVELIGFYGGDLTHSLSAWTSTDRELTDEKRNRLGKLLKDLAEAGHETPFEKSFLHFLVTTDIATHIHLIKHRIGVSVNAESARYKELKEDRDYIPDDWPLKWQDTLRAHNNWAHELYHAAVKELSETLGRKRAKESARFFLPYATQITADISFNFRSFMHFQRLRNSEHAQKEVRDVSQEMLRVTRETGAFNLSLEAFGYAV